MDEELYSILDINSEGKSEQIQKTTKLSYILFSFEGRINRLQFWFSMLLVNIIPLIGLLIDIRNKGTFGNFYLIGVIIILLPSIAINVKRCHDRNRSGWFYLVGLIPLVNIWYVVEVYFPSSLCQQLFY